MKKHLIGFVDQVACQNLSNSPRTIQKKDEKAIHVQNPDKFKVTGIGFQGINANSIITTPENSQIQEMIKFFIEVRIANCEDDNTIKNLEKILKCEDITTEKIQEVLEDESLDLEQLKEKISKQMKNTKDKSKLVAKLQRGINQEKTDDERKINACKRKILLNLLEPFKDRLHKEKSMIIILDNYPVHKSIILKQACEFLNIILVPLPPYSPKLNPIEQVWRTVKNELSTDFIEDEQYLIDNFKRIYYEIVDNYSFVENWIRKFLKEGITEVELENICLNAELKFF